MFRLNIGLRVYFVFYAPILSIKTMQTDFDVKAKCIIFWLDSGLMVNVDFSKTI